METGKFSSTSAGRRIGLLSQLGELTSITNNHHHSAYQCTHFKYPKSLVNAVSDGYIRDV